MQLEGFVNVGCAALVGLVFAAAVAGKVRGRATGGSLAASLAATGLVPRRLARPAAVVLIAAEAAVAAGMAPPATRPWALAAAVAVAGALAAGVGLVLRRGVVAQCQCFGATRERLGPLHLARNVMLLAAAAAGLAADLAAGGAAAIGAPGALLATGAGAVGALLLVRIDDLAVAFRPSATS
ncbi:MauE/DoxX family redox-associated membrane protein [Dactylosporangium sp. CA-233914]|uniref:MauE/DoxX family redox-associated membrane protein n=1 Tax=Dactylosporangium sp. CA-233914 TaxID=3239934 RepID=UPI003D91BADF